MSVSLLNLSAETRLIYLFLRTRLRILFEGACPNSVQISKKSFRLPMRSSESKISIGFFVIVINYCIIIIIIINTYYDYIINT
jgi:hypothetical protein